MALTKIGTDGIKDDAVTSDKVANAINSSIAANTAKDLTALSASNLTSGTIPDARFPTTLPAASAANLTNVPAANITGTLPAISGANLTNLPASGKATNFVINGAMNAAQRSSSAVTTSDGSNEGYTTVDRWQTIFAGSAGGALSTEQSTDAPDAFEKSVLLKCTTASTSLSGSEHVLFSQKLEGQDLSSLEWGGSSPKSVTFSWYMKAVNPKTLAAHLTTPVGSGRYYLKKFTPTTSWARYSFTIPGDSVALPTGTAQSLAIRFGLSIGSGMQQANDSTAWSSTAAHGVSGQGNFLDSTSNQLFITGVQVELGDTATDYAHESYADTLAKCQRYLCVALPKGSRATFTECASMYTDQQIQASVNFPVTMRTTPSLVYSNVSQYFIAYSANNNALFSSMNFESDVSSNSTGAIYANVGSTSGDWTGNSAMMRDHHNDAYIYFEAEL